MARFLFEFVVAAVALLLAWKFVIIPVLRVLGYKPGSWIARKQMQTEARRQRAAVDAASETIGADKDVDKFVVRASKRGTSSGAAAAVRRAGGKVPSAGGENGGESNR